MIWTAPVSLLLASTLFDQSVVQILQRNFPEAQFILVETTRGQVIGSRWTDSTVPVPVGSLVKPFTAIAAGPSRRSFQCDPAKCWLQAGHGRLTLVQAIADSCNSYFLQLARGISEDQVRTVAQRYALPLPASMAPEALTGFGADWLISPVVLAKAYGEIALAQEASTVREGMRESANHGTGKAIGLAALAKTGTAPCSHVQKAPGDGYVVVLYPARSPKYVLLVQVHGVSGAVAATTAGRMTTVLRDGK